MDMPGLGKIQMKMRVDFAAHRRLRRLSGRRAARKRRG